MTALPPLVIRDLRLDAPAVFAPMAGYTDLPCRLLARRFGAGLVYTEMVNVDGIVRGAPDTLFLLTSDPAERPLAAHLYGHDPAVFAEAAAYVERLGRFDLIDINAGCPVPKVLRRGAGAGLLKNPEKLFAIVRAVRAAVKLPVTVKTRIGVSPNLRNISEVARGIEDAGADALALHARFTSERHSGPADWETIARIKQERRLTILGNGGVLGPEQAVECLRRYGVDGVMIGRGAVGQPWLFDQIRRVLAGEPYAAPTLAERRALIVEHLERNVALARVEQEHKRRKREPEEVAGDPVRHTPRRAVPA